MTQTLSKNPSIYSRPYVAMVINHHAIGVQRHLVPMQTVEQARDEFGGTLADAQRFVDATMCNECGTEAAETRETAAFELSCISCGEAGCRCVLSEDPHSTDTWFCSDCQQVCGCRDCTDD
jgi:hypothetical protein